MAPDFRIITETPGFGATAEQLERLRHRYSFAVERCGGHRVLEVACGSAMGLGLLAASAARVTSGDYVPEFLSSARNHYGDRAALVVLDAQQLPFGPGSFDSVVIFEAIYYLPDPEGFLKECVRVLGPGGQLVLCSVNKEWSDFGPSALSRRYYSADELRRLLESHGMSAELFGAFPVGQGGGMELIKSLVRRAAVALNMMPRSMRGKRFLKRLFYGKMTPLPMELTAGDRVEPLVTPLPRGERADRFKILYAVGRVAGG